MNNFAELITPARALMLHIKMCKEEGIPQVHYLDYYKRCAENSGLCEICEVEEVWKFGDTGMCFSCTTGEADASDDYELI